MSQALPFGERWSVSAVSAPGSLGSGTPPLTVTTLDLDGETREQASLKRRVHEQAGAPGREPRNARKPQLRQSYEVLTPRKPPKFKSRAPASLNVITLSLASLPPISGDLRSLLGCVVSGGTSGAGPAGSFAGPRCGKCWLLGVPRRAAALLGYPKLRRLRVVSQSGAPGYGHGFESQLLQSPAQ